MGDEAPAPPPAPTTESGATMWTVSPWVSAAVVAAYATRAMWVKLRSAAGKRKLPKHCQDERLEPVEDIYETEEEAYDSDPEAESQVKGEGDVAPVKQDEMLKHILPDAGPVTHNPIDRTVAVANR